ncbi:hypothetical protein QQF64_010204 [Cirrhinus molitorella]|uniref:Uncharacterized protein n=1 Tax=Cirrhinus molitorella TaxID=172907 RepID=A0ABR3M3B5_9TELE
MRTAHHSTPERAKSFTINHCQSPRITDLLLACRTTSYQQPIWQLLQRHREQVNLAPCLSAQALSSLDTPERNSI